MTPLTENCRGSQSRVVNHGEVAYNRDGVEMWKTNELEACPPENEGDMMDTKYVAKDQASNELCVVSSVFRVDPIR
jgi:hypothetical protein